jgi:hypothetical protein
VALEGLFISLSSAGKREPIGGPTGSLPFTRMFALHSPPPAFNPLRKPIHPPPGFPLTATAVPAADSSVNPYWRRNLYV